MRQQSRGSSQRIGDRSNGNSLRLIELLSHYDKVLGESVTQVAQSQKKGERLVQVHYLSSDSQNEFISECTELIKGQILQERLSSKYFAIMVDATPDSYIKSKQHFCYGTCCNMKVSFQLLNDF